MLNLFGIVLEVRRGEERGGGIVEVPGLTSSASDVCTTGRDTAREAQKTRFRQASKWAKFLMAPVKEIDHFWGWAKVHPFGPDVHFCCCNC